jgi:hypothetical protein
MKRMLTAWLLTALFLASTLCVAYVCPLNASDTPDRAAQEIDQLIRQLGDEDFATREEATRRLMMRMEAIPALRKALKSPDPETAKRAAQVLEAFNHKEDKRVLARLQELGKNGEADQAAELLVRRQKWEDEEAAWQVMTGLAAKVVELGCLEFGEKHRVPTHEHEGAIPLGDFRQWAKEVHPEFLASGRVANDPKKQQYGRFVVRAEDISVVDGMGMAHNLFVAAGAVRGAAPTGSTSSVIYTVIFAGGSVEFDEIACSVVVCDGNVTVRNRMLGCLIVARGEVRCSGSAADCRIITSGNVHFGEGTNTKGTQVKEREATPLGFIKFFDSSRAGISVLPAEGGVRVAVAAEGKPFALAGVQAEDVVETLDGRAVATPQAFRRMLRTALAEGGEMVFKVRRAGQVREIRVPCPEW